MPSPNTSSSASSVAPTYIQNTDALLSGIKWGGVAGEGVILSYSFPWMAGAAASFAGSGGLGAYSTLNEPGATYHFALNAVQQAAARAALQTWADVANIGFQEVADTPASVGDIRIAFTSVPNQLATGGQSWGWAYEPNASAPVAGDIWISTLGTGGSDSNWSVGSYNYFSLIHEAGHALGLKHPFEAPIVLPGLLDNRQYTVMAYNTPVNDLFRTITYTATGATSVIWRVPCETPMVLDIAAIQYLYGANNTFHAGDDTYTFDPATPFFKTLWDAGGNDTITVSNFTENCRIDLNPGNYSSIRILSAPVAPGYTFSGATQPNYDGSNNLGIAYGVVIENVIGGSGNDILLGNDANNVITGGAGNDTIDGGAGIDTAVYSALGSGCMLAISTGVCIVTDLSGTSGTDTLSNIERLVFSDTNVALDIINGHAGFTAKVLGVTFGTASLSYKDYVGVGLASLDGGMTYQNLLMLALNAKLGAGFSNEAEVALLYQNLTGIAPPPAELAYWVGTIVSGQYTQSSLAEMAAEHSLNVANIDLAGLVQTGIQYV